MDSPHTIGLFRGPEISARLDDVARLRINVFRAWPYLYEGSFEYEREYLAAYARSKDGLFVLAFDDGEVVAASGRIRSGRWRNWTSKRWKPVAFARKSLTIVIGTGNWLPALRAQAFPGRCRSCVNCGEMYRRPFSDGRSLRSSYKKSRLPMAGIIHNEIAASAEPIPNAASTSLG